MVSLGMGGSGRGEQAKELKLVLWFPCWRGLGSERRRLAREETGEQVVNTWPCRRSHMQRTAQIGQPWRASRWFRARTSVVAPHCLCKEQAHSSDAAGN